ncbi:hypothetical protein BASA62_008129 [Batrachochytrium salamandrivorans]|nr:hypothetical protein BASA62_008129 [Batrachochytrium salamandrivorans]
MKLNACLTSDAWSNIKNEPIVNYMLISDSSTFFLESVSTGEQSHDAKWIAQDMGRMIDSLARKGTSFKEQASRKRVSRRSMTSLRTLSERTRVEDLIFDYGSETEQAQQMGKKESNVSSVYQFCDQGQSQQGSKGFSLLMLEKGTKTILPFWLVDVLILSTSADLALAGVRYVGNQDVKDWVDMETSLNLKSKEIDIVI